MAGWLQDVGERCLMVLDWRWWEGWLWWGQKASAGRCAGACGWRRVCLLGLVTGEKVACEGTGLEEFWDELKGGRGAAGQRTWVGREMGLTWCCTGQVSWSSHGGNCGGGVWGGSVQASAQGQGRGNEFQLGWGELGLVFVGSDHPLTTFFRPGKVLNGVDSVFLISLLSFLSMPQCVPFRSPVMFLCPPA